MISASDVLEISAEGQLLSVRVCQFATWHGIVTPSCFPFVSSSSIKGRRTADGRFFIDTPDKSVCLEVFVKVSIARKKSSENWKCCFQNFETILTTVCCEYVHIHNKLQRLFLEISHILLVFQLRCKNARTKLRSFIELTYLTHTSAIVCVYGDHTSNQSAALNRASHVSKPWMKCSQFHLKSTFLSLLKSFYQTNILSILKFYYTKP